MAKRSKIIPDGFFGGPAYLVHYTGKQKKHLVRPMAVDIGGGNCHVANNAVETDPIVKYANLSEVIQSVFDLAPKDVETIIVLESTGSNYHIPKYNAGLDLSKKLGVKIKTVTSKSTMAERKNRNYTQDQKNDKLEAHLIFHTATETNFELSNPAYGEIPPPVCIKNKIILTRWDSPPYREEIPWLEFHNLPTDPIQCQWLIVAQDVYDRGGNQKMLDNENGLYAHAPRSIQRATAFKQTLPSRVGVLAERVQIKKRKMPDMGNKKARKAGMKSLRPEARRIFAILKKDIRDGVCKSYQDIKPATLQFQEKKS